MLRTLFFGLTATAVMGTAQASGDRYNITPAEHAACDGDAERLCMSAYPDENKLMGCMKANLDQLTPVCLTTFEAGIKRRRLSL